MIEPRSFFADDNDARSKDAEVFSTLFEAAGVKVEKIVSHGKPSPPGFWYDQPTDEWVMLVQGEAALEVEGQGTLALMAGDHVVIPAQVRHRVTRVSADARWLAVHVSAR